MLESTLLNSKYDGVAASIIEAISGDEASFVSIAKREELYAKLVEKKQEKLALENMLEGTMAIAAAAPTTAEMNDDIKPNLSPDESIFITELPTNAGTDTDNRAGNSVANVPAKINADVPCAHPTTNIASISPCHANVSLSLSISQQEVDATGNLKEYIPHPTYFSQKIPSVVVVYHAPEQEGQFSVAMQSLESHHTMNLKRSDNKQNATNQRWFLDCCGGVIARDAQQKKMNAYDYDTIETDDDRTDFSLNTMDSRLNYIRSGHRHAVTGRGLLLAL